MCAVASGGDVGAQYAIKNTYMGANVIMLQEEPRGPSVLVEILVNTNGQQRVPLPDVAQLRSTIDQKVIWKGIRLISNEVLTNGIISGAVVAPPAELQKMSLTIYSEGWEKGQTIPLLTLNDMQFTVGAIPFRFNPTALDNWMNVDLPKSYLQYANTTSSAGTPYVVLLDVLYIKLDKFGNPIPGPTA